MAEKNADAILQRLIRILSQENVIYTKLLTVLEEKQQAIVNGEVYLCSPEFIIMLLLTEAPIAPYIRERRPLCE